MQRDLPSGTVTFCFTDVEGSTRLLQELGAERYAQALAEHRRTLRSTFASHGGVEVDTQGDAFFYAFPTAPGALQAAAEATEALAGGRVRVRIGIHTGTPLLTNEGYVGADVHKAARIAAAGHGGQILVSSTTTALLDGELTDLGEHRLKDLSAAEQIYQLGDRDFPPLKTLYRTNLPVPATPFLGREHELSEVGELLARDDVRLLTLLGPGGIGKTRLALQAAAEAAERYQDGVFWVPLAPLRDSGLVLDAASQAVGATDGLADYVADKRLLLLLDNFEHLISAASELALLLQSCPNLSMVVTSRELLQLASEQSYPVPPLEPDDGLELFVARAKAVKPAFEPDETVPGLCERLDNLPLALELAAARVRMLSPEQVLERLGQRLDLFKAGRDADPRQQTLRATIEWSYDLLKEEEQALFARLAIFAGGCTLEAAEEICDADLDTLQSLVDKSLLHVGDEERFWMLEAIREFALERLEESGELERRRRRHAEYFLALAEDSESRLRKGDQEWIDRLDRDHANVRAALDTLEALEETQIALRLAGAAWWYWIPRGHVAEGSRRLVSLLAEDEQPTHVRAKALNGAAEMAAASGDAVAARAHAETALALHRELGDTWGVAHSLYLLGYAASTAADVAKNERFAEQSARLYREAQAFLEKSIALYEQLGDEHFALIARYQLAYTHIELGDGERGKAMREDIVRRARELGDTPVQALALGGLIRFAFAEERFEDALRLLGEALRIQLRLGDLRRVALLLGRAAYPLATFHQPETATLLLARSLALFEEIGIQHPRLEEEHAETLRVIREQLDDRRFDEAWARGRKLTSDQAVALALEELENGA